MNLCSFGLYENFIADAVQAMDIKPGEHILDLGCGTGRNSRLIWNHLDGQGHITGMDVSEEMGEQFRRKFSNDQAEFIKQRIDMPFNLLKFYDKILISFVIHGLPHEYRDTVIQNAYNHLKEGGRLYILDYAEFDIRNVPLLPRLFFRIVECRYAYDFIERDWKKYLEGYGFADFTEHYFVRNYVRLLGGRKTG